MKSKDKTIYINKNYKKKGKSYIRLFAYYGKDKFDVLLEMSKYFTTEKLIQENIKRAQVSLNVVRQYGWEHLDKNLSAVIIDSIVFPIKYIK